MLIGVAIALVLAVALRMAAPTLVTGEINRRLQSLGAYRGHVADVDLALWRGAYVIREFTIEKADSPIEEPLLSVPRTDLSVQWRALLRGEVVADAMLTSPVVTFVHRTEDSQYGEGTDWRAELESLTPIRVNRVEIRDGRVTFLNPDARPPVDVFLSGVDVVVADLTNVRESDAPVFTGLEASATAMSHAPVELRGRFDPLQTPPQFDLNLDLRDLDLTRLNPLFKAYAGVTAERGTFSVSAEAAAAEGAFEGYVKPLLDGAAFVSAEDFRERPLGALWDAVVGALSELFENQARNRLGTRVPVGGKLDPKIELWPAVGGVIGNMFDALLQGVEGTVDLRDALQRQDSRGSGEAAASSPEPGEESPETVSPTRKQDAQSGAGE